MITVEQARSLTRRARELNLSYRDSVELHKLFEQLKSDIYQFIEQTAVQGHTTIGVTFPFIPGYATKEVKAKLKEDFKGFEVELSINKGAYALEISWNDIKLPSSNNNIVVDSLDLGELEAFLDDDSILFPHVTCS